MNVLMVVKKCFCNKVNIFCLLVLLSPALGAGFVWAEKKSASEGQVKEDKVVVEVNGNKLTQKEIDAKVNRTLASLSGRISPEQMEQFKVNIQSKLIDDFVTRTLLNEEIEKNHIKVDDSEVNNAVKEIEAKVPEGMTLEDMLQQGGLSMDELRDNILFSLRANKLFDMKIKTDYVPTDKEIKKYYEDNKQKFGTPETVHARHILIKTSDKDDEKTKAEKKKKIEALRKQLLDGADFAKLAKEDSECPSGAKGGDLGTFPRGRMVKPFEDAAFSQKVNEIGPVVETKFGYHIIQVLEHNQANQESLEEAKGTITETFQNRKKQEMARDYIDGLKKNAKIVYNTSEKSPK